MPSIQKMAASAAGLLMVALCGHYYTPGFSDREAREQPQQVELELSEEAQDKLFESLWGLGSNNQQRTAVIEGRMISPSEAKPYDVLKPPPLTPHVFLGDVAATCSKAFGDLQWEAFISDPVDHGSTPISTFALIENERWKEGRTIVLQDSKRETICKVLRSRSTLKWLSNYVRYRNTAAVFDRIEALGEPFKSLVPTLLGKSDSEMAMHIELIKGDGRFPSLGEGEALRKQLSKAGVFCYDMKVNSYIDDRDGQRSDETFIIQAHLNVKRRAPPNGKLVLVDLESCYNTFEAAVFEPIHHAVLIAFSKGTYPSYDRLMVSKLSPKTFVAIRTGTALFFVAAALLCRKTWRQVAQGFRQGNRPMVF